MSRTKVLENVKLTSFDDLFGGKNIEKAAEAGDVKEVPLSELHEFYNHPFQIRSDEELAEMIESVREHGVLVPGIVRKRKEGGYEIIAGHTRKHVCEILGFETMPVFVKEMDDDEASLVMVVEGYRAEKFVEYTDGAEPLTKMDTDFMLKTLDHIKVFEDGTLLVVFLDGTEIECKNEEE